MYPYSNINMKGMKLMKITKKQLSDLLGITLNNLKKIEQRKQLKERLKEKGYLYKGKTKEGRKNIYIIDKINNVESSVILKDIYKNAYNTNKKDSFTLYFINRTQESVKNKADIAKESNVTVKTITKWDNTLLDKRIISKDGFFYFCIDKENKAIYQCSKEEYNNFWKNSSIRNSFKALQNKYIKGEITLNELQLASAGLGATQALIENKYYYRTKKYKTNTENQLYKDTLNLIHSVYGEVDLNIKTLE